MIHRHERRQVFVLGDESDVISKHGSRRDRQIAAASRPGRGEDAVTNSIEFARFANGNFGWNINDPGHGFVIASAVRPLDAAAAASLRRAAAWGPLLVTDDADDVAVPAAGLPARRQAGLP